MVIDFTVLSVAFDRIDPDFNSYDSLILKKKEKIIELDVIKCDKNMKTSIQCEQKHLPAPLKLTN